MAFAGVLLGVFALIIPLAILKYLLRVYHSEFKLVERDDGSAGGVHRFHVPEETAQHLAATADGAGAGGGADGGGAGDPTGVWTDGEAKHKDGPDSATVSEGGMMLSSASLISEAEVSGSEDDEGSASDAELELDFVDSPSPTAAPLAPHVELSHSARKRRASRKRRTIQKAKAKAKAKAKSMGHAAKKYGRFLLKPRGDYDAESVRDYFIDLHCFYREERWWWFVLLMTRKNVTNLIYLRGINSDDHFDWRLTLVLAFAAFVCLEISAQPYRAEMDNLMDVTVMVILIVILHIGTSASFYRASALRCDSVRPSVLSCPSCPSCPCPPVP
jgi:hypothetical protein